MPIDAAEARRKAVHIGMGGFALALRYFNWWQAAACAGLALIFNLWILPRLGGEKLLRGGHGRWGIILYPATVLVLILAFRERLEVAAAAWGILAVGDGMASVFGKGLKGPRLPWNPDKSWAGSVAYALLGGLAAGWLILWVAPGRYSGTVVLVLAFVGAAVAALVESIPSRLDDNVTAPLAAAITIRVLLATIEPRSHWSGLLAPSALQWLAIAFGVNLAVAILARATRIVAASGAWAGLVVGTVILGFGGWGSYAVLWTFFALGTLATKWKYAEKAKLGAAQEGGGKRGAKHAFANCGAAAVFALLAAGAGSDTSALIFRVAFVAAFATALADTFGSELGSVYGKAPRLITTWRAVPPGTDGAISFPGTVGGLIGAGIVAAVGWLAGLVPREVVGGIVLGAFAGTTIESVLGALLESRQIVDNEVQNFLNTVVGAAAAIVILFPHLIR